MILLASAAVLLLAAIAAWFVAPAARPAARVDLRFAAILFAALAVAAVAMPSAKSAVALLVLPIALTVLALAAAAASERAAPAGLAATLLGAVSLAALGAALSGLAALALAPAMAAAVAAAWLHLRRLRPAMRRALEGLAASLCFVAALAAFARSGVESATLLFCAAGLVGIVLGSVPSDAAIEERAGPDLRSAIGGGRGR